MSSPDHIIHRGSSRRWDYNQKPQQDLMSPRPNYKAHSTLDGAYSLGKQSSRRTSINPKDDTLPRNNFRSTRTLKDAFETTSRTVAMGTNTGGSPAMHGRTPSPSSRRHRSSQLPSPYAEVTSPPPGELLETYQRINDADDLADLVSEDDLGVPEDGISRRSSRERRRHDSPGSLNLRYTRMEERHDNLAPAFSYLDDVTDDYVRGKLSMYKRDEERLNRATTSQSPVFSKARVGSKADGLQRRESDPQTEQAHDLGGDDEVHLGLNVPKSWGNKSKAHRQWLSSITGNTPRGETPGRSTGHERRAGFESRSRSPPLTEQSPSRYALKNGGDHGSRPASSRIGAPPSDGLHNTTRARSRSLGRSGLTGDTIPNTPITVYKSTSQDRSQKMRSDSRELLRKLARTESPVQQSTPEPQKLMEASLPQKTPVVIGAWVDTPMTVRNTGTTEEDDTKEIDSPSKTASKSTIPSTVAPQPSSSADTFNKDPSDQTTVEINIQEAASISDVSSENSPNADSKKEPKLELIKPRLPKSALEGIIEDAKSNGNPLLLGDDTINSLQGLMDDMEKSPSRFAKMEEEDLKKELATIESDITQQQSHDKDTQSLDRLGSKLQSIIHSIHDARTGLNVLEETIADGHVKRCETCSTAQHDHSDGRIYVAIPIPRLWHRDHLSRRLRLTYIGWAVVFFTCWYISESTMCDYYCHPTIAEVCDGYCLQPDAPRFPFTLPTMLWRWSHLSNILTPIVTIFVAFVRLVAQLLGVWDGYVDDANLTAFQWSSPPSPYFKDVSVDAPERGKKDRLFGLWPKENDKDSSPHLLTSSSFASTASASLPTILQRVLQDTQDTEVGDSMDDDVFL